jgi:hypothetical protein
VSALLAGDGGLDLALHPRDVERGLDLPIASEIRAADADNRRHCCRCRSCPSPSHDHSLGAGSAGGSDSLTDMRHRRLASVNTEWAIAQLKEYRRLIDEIDATNNSTHRAPLIEDLHHRFTTVAAIMNEVRPNSGKAAQVPVRGHAVNTSTARIAVTWIIGDLERAEEREANMQTSAPKLSADALHPWVWDAARSLWDTGHYRQAVSQAATIINNHVQQIVRRRDVSDSELLTSVFSEQPPKGGQPRLRWPGDPNDKTVKSMNAGLARFAPGAFMTIRNVATHETDELSQQTALEQLAVLSQLARWVEQCDIEEAQQGSGVDGAA